jgi:hypothetical protein
MNLASLDRTRLKDGVLSQETPRPCARLSVPLHLILVNYKDTTRHRTSVDVVLLGKSMMARERGGNGPEQRSNARTMAGRYSNDFIQKCGGMYIKDLKGSSAVNVRNFFCLLTLLATEWLTKSVIIKIMLHHL